MHISGRLSEKDATLEEESLNQNFEITDLAHESEVASTYDTSPSTYSS
jgi:hypothetical protein